MPQLSDAALGRKRQLFSPQSCVCAVKMPGLNSSTCSGFPSRGTLARLHPKNPQVTPVGGQRTLVLAAFGNAASRRSDAAPSRTKLAYQQSLPGLASAAATPSAVSAVHPSATEALSEATKLCRDAKHVASRAPDVFAGMNTNFVRMSKRSMSGSGAEALTVGTARKQGIGGSIAIAMH